MAKDRILTIRFEQDLFEQVKTCAEAEDRSVASLVRHLARLYVEAGGGNRPNSWDATERGSPPT